MQKQWRFSLFILFSCIYLYVAGSENDRRCVEDQDYYGATNPHQFSGYLDKGINTGYLIFGPRATADCCGVVDMWTIIANLERTGKVRTLALQVWRPTVDNNTTYTLVGQNTHVISREGAQGIGTGFRKELVVMKGDRFGWYAEINMIEHNSYASTSLDVVLYKSFDDMPTVGRTVVDWSTATVRNKTGYAMQIKTKQGAYPRILNPSNGEIFTVPPWYTENAYVTNMTYFDADAGDKLALNITLQNDTQYGYYFDEVSTEGTVRLYVKSVPLREGKEMVYFSVRDICGQTTDIKFTVMVVEMVTTPSVRPPSTTTSTMSPSTASTSHSSHGNTGTSMTTSVVTVSSTQPNGGAFFNGNIIYSLCNVFTVVLLYFQTSPYSSRMY